jgi:hypothetical protein
MDFSENMGSHTGSGGELFIVPWWPYPPVPFIVYLSVNPKRFIISIVTSSCVHYLYMSFKFSKYVIFKDYLFY